MDLELSVTTKNIGCSILSLVVLSMMPSNNIPSRKREVNRKEINRVLVNDLSSLKPALLEYDR